MAAAPPIPREQDLYDEAGYLRLYPGIGKAVASGAEATAWHHYDKHGRREGRHPNDVDAAFYIEAYPQVAQEMAAGHAGDAAEHYIKWGRGRGYLPNATAPRPAAAAMPPCIPWLWTDQPHASDLIESQLDLGSLKQRQANLLRSWVRDGYAVLDRTIDRDIVEPAARDLERAFAGASPDLLFLCPGLSHEPLPWQPEINPLPADALDLHMLSRAVRNLLLAEPIFEFLSLIFAARPLVVHSRGRLRDAPAQAAREFASPGFTLARQCAGVWIPLEDAADDAGTLYHFAGTHRYPEMPDEALHLRVTEMGLLPDRFAGVAGRAVIRHPQLVRGGRAGAPLSTCRGIYVQYCPSFVAPLYAEEPPTRLWRHGAGFFTTQYYRDLEVMD